MRPLWVIGVALDAAGAFLRSHLRPEHRGWRWAGPLVAGNVAATLVAFVVVLVLRTRPVTGP